MKSLSIVIPAYNEEKRLPPTLDQLDRFARGSSWESLEVLVVDDGSRDGTADFVRQAAETRPYLRLVSNPGNRGKGYAVRNGVLSAQGDWILTTDADLSAPLIQVDQLWCVATQQNAQIVIGSRAVDRSRVLRHQPWTRELSGRAFNLVMRLVTGLPFRDTQCGFKLFSREAAQGVFSRQQLDGFGFDVETLFIARKLNLLTVEEPVTWSDVEGSKVSVANGLAAFTDLYRIRRNHAQGRYR